MAAKSTTLRFTEGHKTAPKDWTEKILLDIRSSGFYGGRRYLDISIWVSKDDWWWFVCNISCDDIYPTKWGALNLMKDGESISLFSMHEALLSIRDYNDFDAISSTTLFREGLE